jgi:hypothetical protein
VLFKCNLVSHQSAPVQRMTLGSSRKKRAPYPSSPGWHFFDLSNTLRVEYI